MKRQFTLLMLFLMLSLSFVYGKELIIAKAPDDILQINSGISAKWFQTFKSNETLNMTGIKFYIYTISGSPNYNIDLYDANDSVSPLASFSGSTNALTQNSFNILYLPTSVFLDANHTYWVQFNVSGGGYVDFASTYYNNNTDADCWYYDGSWQTCSPFNQSDFTMSILSFPDITITNEYNNQGHFGKEHFEPDSFETFLAQSFYLPQTAYVTGGWVFIDINSTFDGGFRVELVSDLNGQALASVDLTSITPRQTGDGIGLNYFNFTEPRKLSAGTYYFRYSIINTDYPPDGWADTYNIGINNANPYPNGVFYRKGILNNASWFDWVVQDADFDMRMGVDYTPADNTCTAYPHNGCNVVSSLNFNDRNYTLPAGIHITNDNLILDCQGARLIGNYSDKGIQLNTNNDNVTIRNCEITGYQDGIYSGGTQANFLMENNDLFHNWRHLYVGSSYNSEFRNNIFGIRDGGGYGFWHYFSDEPSPKIYNNRFDSPSFFGYYNSFNRYEVYNNTFNEYVYFEGVNSLVYNNIFNFSNSQSTKMVRIEGTEGGGYFGNNSIYGNTFISGNVTEFNNINIFCVEGIGNLYFNGADYYSIGAYSPDPNEGTCLKPNATRRYMMEETIGTVMADNGTAGVDGFYDTSTNGIELDYQGINGKAIHFVTQNLTQGEGVRFLNTGLNISDATDTTISFWIKFPLSSAQTQIGIFPNDFHVATNYTTLHYEVLGGLGGNDMRFMLKPYSNAGFWSDVIVPSSAVDITEWNLVTFSISGKTDRKIRVYINGDLIDEDDIGFSGGNPILETDFGGFTRDHLSWIDDLYLDDYRIYTDLAMDERDALALLNSYPIPPRINSVTNSTTSTTIDLSFTYTNQLDYVEWYIDGSLDANNTQTSHTYSGLNTSQPYNVSFQLHNADGYTEWSGIITPQITCVVPTNTLYQNGEFHFCQGEYGSIRNLQIGNNARVYFHPSGTLLSGYDDPQNEQGVINIVGDNALLDCGGIGDTVNWNTSNRGITGATENDGSGMGNGQGTRGINFWGDANNNTIQNCHITHNKFNLFTWIDVSNNKFYNISLDDSMYSGYHGGGDYAILDNVISHTDIFLLGLHQFITNSYANYGFGLGHPDPCCTTARWSGQLINSNGGGINLHNFPSSDSYNITNNYVNGDFNLNDGGGNNGQQFFYNNNADNWMNDNTDYNGGNFVTFCVDGVGNTYGAGYNGGDPDFGTCPAPYCHLDFVSGCRITQDVTLTNSSYYVQDIWTQTGDNVTTLDCQGATIYGQFDESNNNENGVWSNSKFIRIDNTGLTIKNCNFKDFFNVVQSNNPNGDTIWDNISWVEYKAPYFEDCPDCGFYNHFPQFYMWWYVPDAQTIKNSYFEGEGGLGMNRDFYKWYGDYCPDTSDQYVQNSDNCNDWDYSNGATEEECAPDMWNAGLNRCEDSRATWWGGNCNGCDINWQWFNGYWYACNLDNINNGKQTGFYFINNIINKTNTSLNGDALADSRFPTVYGVSDVEIINNTYLSSDNPDTQNDAFVRLSGCWDVQVEGNKVLMGKFNKGFNIFAHEWDTPNCPNVNVNVVDNYFEAGRSYADGGFFGHNQFSGVHNGLIQGNVYNVTPDSDRYLNWISLASWDTDVLNITFTKNNFLPYDLSYDIYQQYYTANQQDNIDIFDNNFNTIIIGDRQKGWDVKVYNNTFRQTLFVEDSYSPYTTSEVDICNGVGNTYLSMIAFEFEQDFGYTTADAWLDPACNPLNVPDGILVKSYAYDTNMNIGLYGNGITLTGDGNTGILIDGNDPTFIENSQFGDINIVGYQTSLFLGNFTQTNTLQNINADACIIDDGNGNIRTNVSDNCICNEDWQMVANPCQNNRKKPIIYHDINECGTYNDLPANNGTMQDCIPPYNATHQSSDISGVTVDTIVEVGIEYVKYTPLLAVGGIAVYLLFLI